MAALIVMAVSAEALAATQPAPRGESPMRFTLMRSRTSGCEPSCAEWIAAQGAFVKGVARELEKLLAGLDGRRLPILFMSGGGDMNEALAVGELIRARNLDTAVAFVDAAGRFRPGVCLSACPFAFAAGLRRYAPSGARIGLHRVLQKRTTVTVHRKYLVRQRVTETETTTDRQLVSERRETRTSTREGSNPELQRRLRAYLNRMGVSPALLVRMDETPHKDIRELFEVEIDWFGLATHFAGAQWLVEPGEAANGGNNFSVAHVEAYNAQRERQLFSVVAVRRRDEDYVNLFLVPADRGSRWRAPFAISLRGYQPMPRAVGDIAQRKFAGVFLAPMPRVHFCRAALGWFTMNIGQVFMRPGYGLRINGAPLGREAAIYEAACTRLRRLPADTNIQCPSAPGGGSGMPSPSRSSA